MDQHGPVLSWNTRSNCSIRHVIKLSEPALPAYLACDLLVSFG
jgi:hypothetical protein